MEARLMASLSTILAQRGAGSSVYYQTGLPSNPVDGQIWVDSDGEAALLDGNNYFTKAETTTLLETAGFNPFFLGGM